MMMMMMMMPQLGLSTVRPIVFKTTDLAKSLYAAPAW